MVSKASEDLPEPESPVKTISASRGSSTWTSRRLCSRAPRTIRRSATGLWSLRLGGEGLPDERSDPHRQPSSTSGAGSDHDPYVLGTVAAVDRWDDLLAASDGVLLRSEHPNLRAALARATSRGRLVAVLPGVYVDHAGWALRIAAVVRRFPDAVLCGPTAAQLTFWPELSDDIIHVANVRARFSRPGYRLARQIVPPDWVDCRRSVVALTAVDLAIQTSGESIDRALRSRLATVADLEAALAATPGRVGNRERRRLLLDSRSGPWSGAERLAHRILRASGISGWTANYRVRVHGRVYYVDIAFVAQRLAVEIDGRIHERDPTVFENDRRRQNDLALGGWQVLRFTWRMLSEEPEAVAATVRAALRRAERTR